MYHNNKMLSSVRSTSYDNNISLISFHTTSEDGLYTNMTLRNKNVGIGIDNPQHKLDVDGTIKSKKLIVDGDIASNKLDINGTIRAKEVKIETTGWADFVFDENYNLPSLKYVESYILSNKHLPNIPSEKKVKEEGIDLGDMQTKLHP